MGEQAMGGNCGWRNIGTARGDRAIHVYLVVNAIGYPSGKARRNNPAASFGNYRDHTCNGVQTLAPLMLVRRQNKPIGVILTKSEYLTTGFDAGFQIQKFHIYAIIGPNK